MSWAEAFERPESSEYAPYYADYICAVPDGDILDILENSIRETGVFVAAVPQEKETYRYADGKWSVREVLGHVTDTERVMCFRALSFARNDPSPLPSMDENLYASSSNAHDRPLASLFEEFEVVRLSTLALFRSFTPEMAVRRGVASGCDFTVRAFPWMLAGHEIHHRNVLRERYLTGL